MPIGKGRLPIVKRRAADGGERGGGGGGRVFAAGSGVYGSFSGGYSNFLEFYCGKSVAVLPDRNRAQASPVGACTDSGNRGRFSRLWAGQILVAFAIVAPTTEFTFVNSHL